MKPHPYNVRKQPSSASGDFELQRRQITPCELSESDNRVANKTTSWFTNSVAMVAMASGYKIVITRARDITIIYLKFHAYVGVAFSPVHGVSST